QLVGPDSDHTGLPAAPEHEIQRLLDRYAEESRKDYVRMAGRWIRRLGIDELGLAPEGAYGAAWVMLLEDLRDGKVSAGAILAREPLDRIFGLRLLKVLFIERRRQRAGKRRWGLVSRMADDVPEVADPRNGRPEDGIAGREWVDRILDQ